MERPTFTDKDLEIVALPPRETMGKGGINILNISKSFNQLLKNSFRNNRILS